MKLLMNEIQAEYLDSVDWGEQLVIRVKLVPSMEELDMIYDYSGSLGKRKVEVILKTLSMSKDDGKCLFVYPIYNSKEKIIEYGGCTVVDS